MANVGAVVIDFQSNTAAFRKDMGKAALAVRSHGAKINRTLAGMEKGIGRAVKGLKSFAKSNLALGSILATVAGSAGLGLMLNKSLETADGIAKLADRANFGVERLQTLRFAAGEVGVATKDLDDGISRLNRRLGLFSTEGGGPAAKAFAALGIEATDAAGRMKTAEQVFDEAVRALERFEDPAQQAAIASQLFGEDAGPRLALLVRKGSAGIAELEQKARDLGIVLNERLVRNAEVANDALERMGAVLRTNVTRAMLSLTPTIIAVGGAFERAAPKIRAFFESFLPDDLLPADTLRKKVLGLEAQIEQFRIKSASATGRRAEVATKRIMAWQAEVDQLRRALADAEAAEERFRKARGERDAPAGGTGAKKKSPFQKRLEALRHEEAQLGRTQIGQRIMNELRAAGVDAASQQARTIADLVLKIEREKEAQTEAAKAAEAIKRVQEEMARDGRAVFEAMRTPIEKYNAEIDRLRKLLDAAAISQDTFDRAAGRAGETLEREQRQADRLAQTADEMGQSFASSFERAVLEGEKLSDTLKALAKDIARIALRKAVTEPLGKAAGEGIGAILGDLFGGARASGGPVIPDKAYLVGERGPELFSPSRAGQIIPNDQLGGGGGMVINIDARGADISVEQRLRQALDQLRRDVPSMAIRTVQDRAQRGGAFGRAIG